MSLNVALWPYHTDMEDIEVRVKCSAHHEAGHIVIAAVQGLRLHSEGLMVDRAGEGLACYFKEPDNNDGSRERVILATLAGLAAENRYRSQQFLPLRTDFELIWSPDCVPSLRAGNFPA